MSRTLDKRLRGEPQVQPSREVRLGLQREVPRSEPRPAKQSIYQSIRLTITYNPAFLQSNEEAHYTQFTDRQKNGLGELTLSNDQMKVEADWRYNHRPLEEKCADTLALLRELYALPAFEELRTRTATTNPYAKRGLPIPVQLNRDTTICDNATTVRFTMYDPIAKGYVEPLTGSTAQEAIDAVLAPYRTPK
jgi:hypothetical protein